MCSLLFLKRQKNKKEERKHVTHAANSVFFALPLSSAWQVLSPHIPIFPSSSVNCSEVDISMDLSLTYNFNLSSPITIPGWPQTYDSPASTFGVPGLQIFDTILGLMLTVLNTAYFFLNCSRMYYSIS
jgi:hypothetical protein